MELNKKELEMKMHLGIAGNKNKGKGWKEIYVGPNLFDYEFECKDCGGRIKGFVVSPRFCPFCGKEQG